MHKHIIHDLLDYLEMENGRLARQEDRYMPAFFERKEIPLLCRSISTDCHYCLIPLFCNLEIDVLSVGESTLVHNYYFN